MSQGAHVLMDIQLMNGMGHKLRSHAIEPQQLPLQDCGMYGRGVGLIPNPMLYIPQTL